MKSKILKLSTVFLLLLLLGANCQKDETERADESIEISTLPGIAVYKTNGNYKDYLAVCIDSVGNITCTPLFGDDNLIVRKDKNGNYVLIRRHFLKSGYITEDIYLDYAFTNITINEMVEKFTEIGPEYWTLDKYKERLIDLDPFSEFYYLDGLNKPVRKFTIKEINEMIEKGTLETVFIKIK